MRWWGWVVGCNVLIAASTVSDARVRPELARQPTASILVDAATGQVLEARNADTPCQGAAINQLMLLLLSLEQAELGGLPLDVPVTIGPQASRVSKSRSEEGSGAASMHLREDQTYLLSDLLKAMLITSADDVAVAVAEAIMRRARTLLEGPPARGGNTCGRWGAGSGR